MKLPISVIICVKNGGKTIKDCLESVIKNNPHNIIIVDGNSTDNTIKIAKKYTNEIYFDKGGGLAFARQLGVEKAKEEWISYVDCDVVLPENCLKNMLREIKRNGWVGIHAQMISLHNRNYWEWSEDQHFRMLFNKAGERHRIGTIATIYKKEAVLKYKFDPFFVGAYEDGDLCYRMVKDGHKVGVSSFFAYHCHRANFNSFKKQKIWYGRGIARMFYKHMSLKFLLAPFLSIPFYTFFCISKGKFKMIPYYIFNGIFATIGMVKEFRVLYKD